MSYLVLARKYRPKNFENVIGQDHVVRALTHALESRRLHHAYLFTGTRGIGKTTLSRILAKSLNCEKGITATPCGECEACKAIDSDRFVDYVEMDAASNRGIADMLQLLEQAIYAPTAARFKVYMIDEVHMLTSQAFNAMLKTLEEPPEYVKFILATTDPQKIPITVLSRCLQFNLKQMPVVQIVAHLERILGQEGVPFEKTALQLLAVGAQGSMRDALSLTDQAIAYTAGKVTDEAVRDMLGTLDRTYLIRLLECLAARDGAGLLKVADEMALRSLSYRSALQDLGLLLHRIALVQGVPDYLAEDLPDHADIARLATLFSPEEIQLYYQIAIHGCQELGLAPDEYAGFSMTLLRMLAFAPGEKKAREPENAPTASSLNRSKSTERVSPVKKAASGAGPKNEPAGFAKEKSLPQEMSGRLDDLSDVSVLPAATNGAVPSSPSRAGEREDANEPNGDSAVSASVSAGTSWNGDWPTLAASLPVRGMTQQLAQQTELVRWEKKDAVYLLHLISPVPTLCMPNNVNKLVSALSEYFGGPVKITTEIGKVEATANQNAIDARAERQRQAEETVSADPYIQSFCEELGGHVVDGSIKPF